MSWCGQVSPMRRGRALVPSASGQVTSPTSAMSSAKMRWASARMWAASASSGSGGSRSRLLTTQRMPTSCPRKPAKCASKRALLAFGVVAHERLLLGEAERDDVRLDADRPAFLDQRLEGRARADHGDRRPAVAKALELVGGGVGIGECGRGRDGRGRWRGRLRSGGRRRDRLRGRRLRRVGRCGDRLRIDGLRGGRSDVHDRRRWAGRFAGRRPCGGRGIGSRRPRRRLGGGLDVRCDAAGRRRGVEQGQLELEAQSARPEARGVDGAQAAGRRDERGVVAAGGQRREQALPDGIDDLVEEHPQVAAAVLERVQQRDPRDGVARRERRYEAVHGLGVREAQQLAHRLGLDTATGRGQQLVEDRLRVAHPAGRESGHQGHGLRVGLAAIGRQDPLELPGDLGHGEPPDVEALQPRQDRGRELLRVRRGEHEGHELGRLLERLEERVPGVLRDLVRLVEDVDLPPQVGRGVGEPLAQLAHGLDPAIGGRVDLDQVQRPALADRDARRAAVAGVRVRLEIRAVDRLGQDPGERRLAGAAWTGEQDGVRDAPGRHGVAQRGDDRLLADDLGERLGPPAAVERLVRDLCGQRRSWAGVSRLEFAVHPPSIRTLPRPPTPATRTRPFRGTRRSPLSAASFRT